MSPPLFILDAESDQIKVGREIIRTGKVVVGKRCRVEDLTLCLIFDFERDSVLRFTFVVRSAGMQRVHLDNLLKIITTVSPFKIYIGLIHARKIDKY